MKRLRYHLGKGENFMKWQLRDSVNDTVEYYEPDTFEFTIVKGKLNNRPSTAKKIFEGENKTVCSWITFKDGVELMSFPADPVRISYNPKLNPHWTSFDYDDSNLDGFEGFICIRGRSLYVKRSELEEFLLTKQIEMV
jgi:hypothetical protein